MIIVTPSPCPIDSGAPYKYIELHPAATYKYIELDGEG